MEIQFYKYQGTGNDFIMIDNRELTFPKDNNRFIEELCHRRFGIGADGLILLENHKAYDFKMVYYNADGNESTMCGNGGRCIVAFAKQLGLIKASCLFEAIDGEHEAFIEEDNTVSLTMKKVENVERISEDAFFIDTGSPHYVKVVDEMPTDFIAQAKKIRYNERFKLEGVNVNFIVFKDGVLQIRTYERGVEDETYSCGTGAVAAGIVNSLLKEDLQTTLSTKGGKLIVDIKKDDICKVVNARLSGEARFVFLGIIDLAYCKNYINSM